VNKLDGAAGRAVWYRCWDTRLTYEKSYLARLAYVHTNPVKHGLVADAREYRWCSAAWFAEKSERAFYETVMSFKTDRVNVYDDF
jgi:putative transposase